MLTARLPPPGVRTLVGSGRFSGRRCGTGLRIRARGRRMSLPLYNEAGDPSVAQVEPVNDEV